MSSPTLSSGDYYDVHLGFWTNWSHGKVQGATITLTRQNGGLLIAFVAIFVGATGKSLWRILCYALHYVLATPTDPRDGFYHQRQAILRNSETALQGGWQLLNSVIIWKRSHTGQRVIRRGIPIAAIAAVLSCGFALAGVFSSRVSSPDANEVLLTGKNCGWANGTIDYTEYLRSYMPWDTQRCLEALSYTRSCYQNASRADGCRLYAKPRLRLSSNRNASCPFADEVCHSPFGNLELDTGYIDIHDDLGLNTRPKDRFFWRDTYRCAPLKSEGFSSVVTFTDSSRGNATTTAYRLFYGAQEGLSHYYPGYSNFTYQFPINVTYARIEPGILTGPETDYSLGIVTRASNVTRNVTYEPIPQIRTPGADIFLLFLSAPDLVFEGIIDDPWFSAHKPYGVTRRLGSGAAAGRTYQKDEPITTLGCTRQIQYCRQDHTQPNGKLCEPLRGYRAPLDNSMKDESGQPLLLAYYNLFTKLQTTINVMLESLGASILDAKYSLTGGGQSALPNNQWQIELEHVVSTYLALVQRATVDAANGPATSGIAKVWEKPTNPLAVKLCQSQKIFSAQFPSFNVLGLSLILLLGFLIILLDLFLEPAIRYIHKCRDRRTSRKEKAADPEDPTASSPTSNLKTQPVEAHPGPSFRALKRMEWNMTSTLQLQRLAHEAVGAGTWKRTSDETPVTVYDQPLGVVDFMTPPNAHPYLVKPVVRENMDAETRSVTQPSETMEKVESNEIEHLETTEKSSRREDDSISLTEEIRVHVEQVK